MKRIAREKLVEKDINWGQVYTDKTQFLKDQYEDIIGVGSYFRFEGKASDGDSYYCIIGPAKVHKPRAKWFAGVRKLPATYSAGGKYFDSMDSAAKYAKETWGVPTPKELKPYTSAQLFGISEKIKKWKKQREENEENKEENEKDLENKKSYTRSMFMKSFNLSKLLKEAMGYTRQENRPVYSWFNAMDPTVTSDPQWQAMVQGAPSLSSVLREAQRMHRSNIRRIEQRYGLTLSQVEQCLKTYVGYDVNYGGYILSLGPYLGPMENSINKFAFYVLRKGHTGEEELLKAMDKKMRSYVDAYNVSLSPEDFKFVSKQSAEDTEGSDRQRERQTSANEFSMNRTDPRYRNFFSRSRMLGAGSHFELATSGLAKVIRSNWGPLFEQAINEVATSRGLTQQEAEVVVMQDSNFIETIYNAIRNKYAEAVEQGDAAIMGMPEPPVLSKLKMAGKAGAQKPTTIQGKQKPLLKKLQLNNEILTVMLSGEQDPQVVMDTINAGRKENKRVPITVVQSIMQDYNDRVSRDNMSLEDVYEEFRQNIDNLESQEEGLTDLRTAFDAAKSHLGHEVFTVEDNFPNITEEDIGEIREQMLEARRRGLPWPPDGSSVIQEEESDIERELEMEVGQAIPEEAPEPIPTEESTRPVQTPATTPNTTPNETPNAIDMLGLEDDVFGSTLDSLMKIAKDLDSEGKIEGAKEIKKIIKKYQKGNNNVA